MTLKMDKAADELQGLEKKIKETHILIEMIHNKIEGILEDLHNLQTIANNWRAFGKQVNGVKIIEEPDHDTD